MLFNLTFDDLAIYLLQSREAHEKSISRPIHAVFAGGGRAPSD
jgi:hypothetical protein